MAKARPQLIRSGRSDIPLLREAFAAQDGAALGWTERDRGLFATLRTYRTGLNPREMMRIPWRLWIGKNGYALGFAVLAALGLILEILVAKKDLFPGGKDELAPAVDASQYLVPEFH
jgi:hypothetical protein